MICNNMNRLVLLPIVVKKGLEAAKSSPLLKCYQEALNQKETFSKLIEKLERSFSAEWDVESGNLRQHLQRSREFVERFGRMSTEPQAAGLSR